MIEQYAYLTLSKHKCNLLYLAELKYGAFGLTLRLPRWVYTIRASHKNVKVRLNCRQVRLIVSMTCPQLVIHLLAVTESPHSARITSLKMQCNSSVPCRSSQRPMRSKCPERQPCQFFFLGVNARGRGLEGVVLR